MTTDSGTWTLETVIWLPVAALLTILFVSLAVYAFPKWRAERASGRIYSDALEWGVATFGSMLLAFLIAGLTALGMYPYSGEYHQWRETSGVVNKIDHRLIGTSDGMEDKFVVRFEGSTQQFGCDDTRCAGVEKGDSLALSCKRAWQFTGTDGYDCRFVSTEPK